MTLHHCHKFLHIPVYYELLRVITFQMQMSKHDECSGILTNGLLDVIAVYNEK